MSGSSSTTCSLCVLLDRPHVLKLDLVLVGLGLPGLFEYIVAPLAGASVVVEMALVVYKQVHVMCLEADRLLWRT